MPSFTKKKKGSELHCKRPLTRNCEIKVVADLLTEIGTTYANECKNLLVNRVPCTLEGPNPSAYSNASDYLADAQAYALVGKHNLLVSDNPMSKSDVAVDKFYEAELLCQKTNYKFKHMDFSFSERSTLELARHYCHMILGSFFMSPPDFGPGATVFLKGQETNIISKLGAKPETTTYAYEYVVRNILHYMPHYALSSGMVIRDRTSVELSPQLASLVPCSVFRTVPKNYKVDRGIAIEPSGQMLMQKGIGCSIRTRLRQFGYDLNSTPDLHKTLAYEGSINGKFVTIDLASASDTVAYEFVRYMLPDDWFYNLDAVRTREIQFGDVLQYRKKLEKFSSMGNGYTFELESVLFLSLLLASRKLTKCENTRVSVFGDDMICHPLVADTLIPLLSVCGFMINHSKTYLTGPFRESCGHDYFNGCRVTPVYFKEKNDDAISKLYYYLNRITALSSAYNFGIGNSGRFKRVWYHLLQRLDPGSIYGGHSSLGDIVVHGAKEIRTKRGKLACLARKSRYFKRTSTACHALACAVYGVPSTGVIPRSAKYTLTVQWLHVDYYPREVFWFKET